MGFFSEGCKLFFKYSNRIILFEYQFKYLQITDKKISLFNINHK